MHMCTRQHYPHCLSSPCIESTVLSSLIRQYDRATNLCFIHLTTQPDKLKCIVSIHGQNRPISLPIHSLSLRTRVLLDPAQYISALALIGILGFWSHEVVVTMRLIARLVHRDCYGFDLHQLLGSVPRTGAHFPLALDIGTPCT